MDDPKQTLTIRNVTEEISGCLCLSSSKVAELLAESNVELEVRLNEGDFFQPFDSFSAESERKQIDRLGLMYKGNVIMYYEATETASDVAIGVKAILEN